MRLCDCYLRSTISHGIFTVAANVKRITYDTSVIHQRICWNLLQLAQNRASPVAKAYNSSVVIVQE